MSGGQSITVHVSWRERAEEWGQVLRTTQTFPCVSEHRLKPKCSCKVNLVAFDFVLLFQNYVSIHHKQDISPKFIEFPLHRVIFLLHKPTWDNPHLYFKENTVLNIIKSTAQAPVLTQCRVLLFAPGLTFIKELRDLWRNQSLKSAIKPLSSLSGNVLPLVWKMGSKYTFYMLPNPATRSGWRRWWQAGWRQFTEKADDAELVWACSGCVPSQGQRTVTVSRPSCLSRTARPLDSVPYSVPFQCPSRSPAPGLIVSLPLSTFSLQQGPRPSTSALHSDLKSKTRACLLTRFSRLFFLNCSWLGPTHFSVGTPTPPPIITWSPTPGEFPKIFCEEACVLTEPSDKSPVALRWETIVVILSAVT